MIFKSAIFLATFYSVQCNLRPIPDHNDISTVGTYSSVNAANRRYDVAIVGGGFAGMSAALFFGRSLLSAVVISAESPRNKVTDFTHNYLTRDGTKPAALLRIAKKELSKYSEFVTYQKDFVTDVAKETDGNGFLVKTRGGKTYTADQIIFATGMQDHLDQLGLPGVKDCYGKSIFHCPFCDGYSRRNKSLAAFSGDPGWTSKFVKVVHQWSNDLVLFTKPGSLGKAEKDLFIQKGIKIYEEKVVKLENRNGYMTGVRLESGKFVPRTIGFLATTADYGSDLPKKLGVTKLPEGNYKTTESWGKTEVDGVYVIGDLKDKFTGAITAASQGNQCAGNVAPMIIEKKFGSA